MVANLMSHIKDLWYSSVQPLSMCRMKLEKEEETTMQGIEEECSETRDEEVH